MEELQDAIEDAQYVNAIATQVQGPRPVLSWEFPEEEELAKWEAKKIKEGASAPNGLEVFGIDWCLQTAVGFFLFSEFLKDSCDDWLRINFIEDIIQWRRLRGVQRLDRSKRIAQKFLKESPVDNISGKRIYPRKRQIITYDIYRELPKLELSDEQRNELIAANKVVDYDSESPPSSNAIGMSGPVLDEIFNSISRTERNFDIDADCDIQLASAELKEATRNLPDRASIRLKYSSMKQLTESWKIVNPSTLNHLFAKADVIVIESLRKQYWQQFTESEEFIKLKNFAWFYDRQVEPDDFFSMRVLGRGGFGSVTGKQYNFRPDVWI